MANWFKNVFSSANKETIINMDPLKLMHGFNPIIAADNVMMTATINSSYGQSYGGSNNSGVYNTAADIGTNRDITEYTRVCPPPAKYNNADFDNIYQTNLFARIIVDVPAEDATKNWRKFLCDEPLIAEERQKVEGELGVKESVKDAMRWATLYGTCALIIDTGVPKGPLDYARPLKDDEIINNKVRGFLPVFITQLNPSATPELNPFSPNFGKPEFYTVTGSETFQIHYTRLIIFDGLDLPLWARVNQGGFGLSSLIPVWNELVNMKLLSSALVNQAMRSNIDHLGMTDFLSQAASACQGKSGINGYLAAQNKILTNQRMMVTDATDTYTRNELSNLGTWPELIKFFAQYVGGFYGLTLSRTLGEQVSGFNSGDSDNLVYTERVHTRQKSISPQCKRIDEVLELSTFGERKEITYEFLPIFVESATQISAREATDSATNTQYLNDGLLTKEIILRRMQKDSSYSITDDYIDEVAKKEKELEDMMPMEGDDALLASLQAQSSKEMKAKPTDAVA